MARPRQAACDKRALLGSLGELLGPDNCLVDPAARSVYARDASPLTLGRPLAVVLPADASEVAGVIRLCSRYRVPLVPRGAGTGLSGGAVPADGAVVLSLARLTELSPVVAEARRVRAAPGVVNERVDLHARPLGLHFAPDPSSESASTIGGNIAENAGGPHCLKWGVTVHHLYRLNWLDPDGSGWSTGRGLVCERGVDLLGLLTGSEGTLAVVTAADLKLTPVPVGVQTLLAFFPELGAATAAVVELVGAGLLPAALEIVDRSVLEAIQAAFGFGFRTDVEAAMILEFAGQPEAVAEDARRAQDKLEGGGACEVRTSRDEADRTDLWRCRKKAFGAVGRLAPSYVTMDVVVPLGRLTELVRAIERIRGKEGVRIATAFHAGDGNLHPGVFYDDRDSEDTARAHRVADAIMDEAVQLGGSLTGEHGVGIEKLHLLPRQLDRQAARLMTGIKQLFDPENIFNPGKVLPKKLENFLEPESPPEAVDFRWDSLTVTAPAAAPVADLQSAALARGLWIPVGGFLPATSGSGLGQIGSVGELVDHLLAGPSLLGAGTVRDYLLEVWAVTSERQPFRAGAPVFKNVAGYDLPRLLCGAGGILARIQGATLQLKPVPECAALWHFSDPEGRLTDPFLWSLLDELAGWPTDLAAPVCVVDGFEVGACGVTVLAAGRDRPWDLHRKEDALVRWAAELGLLLTERSVCPFKEVATLARHPALPGWSMQGGDWTFLAREPEPSGWPEGLGSGRTIWHGSPPLFWMPLAHCDPSAGWHPDTVWRGGRLTPLPPPAAEVPTHLLVGLKDLFDPTGWLGEPDWLAEARRGAR